MTKPSRKRTGSSGSYRKVSRNASGAVSARNVVTLTDGSNVIVKGVQPKLARMPSSGQFVLPEAAKTWKTASVVLRKESVRAGKGRFSRNADAAVPMDELPLKITDAIRNFDLEKNQAWERVTKEHAQARLFAIESSPTSIAIEEGGKFTGRARVLAHVPFALSTGDESFGSMTIPAFVVGSVDAEGSVKISDFRLSFQQSA
jgi:hypothetical protein